MESFRAKVYSNKVCFYVWKYFVTYVCYFHLICFFRPPASASHPCTDLGLFLLLLTFSPLLQTGHHFLLFLLLQPRCMLGRRPTGSPSTLKPPECHCNNRNLWDQGVWDRWCWATAKEERQRREQGEREKRGGHVILVTTLRRKTRSFSKIQKQEWVIIVNMLSVHTKM